MQNGGVVLPAAENIAAAGEEARYVEMRHITDAVLFLASGAASGVSGHVQPVTGAGT